ncbi:MAG: Gfo/Idh/MocA family oxidoreductase [bacterium]
MDRRRFLSSSTKGLVGLSAALAAAKPGRAVSPNDKIIMGTIGVGGRGLSLTKGFIKRKEVEIAYLCDVNSERSEFAELMELLKAERDHPPKQVVDLRRVLEDKDVDAVIISTCDHWHGLATVWACQNGKDVYVEKPPSHNIWEGRKMVEAARKYNCVVQCGTQNRSAPYNSKAFDYIRSGAIGSIPLCKVYNMKSGEPFHKGPDGEPPDSLNYDLWLGPAPWRPYNESVVKGWKCFWDFTAGDIADDGSHQLDIARWLIRKEYPKAVHSSGGHLAFDDDREVPDTMVTTYEFDDILMTFELTQFAPYMTKTTNSIRDSNQFPYWPQNATRIELYGTKQQMIIGRHGGGWQSFTANGEVATQWYGRVPDEPHKDNFLQCIRTRELPKADIEIGHRSACLIHLAAISLRLGGRKLLFDGETEQFTNDEEANNLLKRTYREPYVIPEEV